MNRAPLDEALADVLEILSDGRLYGQRLNAVRARMGLGGQPPVPCAEAGRIAGISGERVRQLERLLRARAAASTVDLPVLDEALAAVASRLPCPAGLVSQVLRLAGVTRAPFSLESLCCAAVLVGKDLPFTVAGRGASAVLVDKTSSTPKELERCLLTARRLSEQRGAFTTGTLLSALGADAHDSDACVRVVRAATSEARVGTVTWLWTPGAAGRGPFADASRRMLATSTPLSVKALTDGLRRRLAARKIRGVAPVSVLTRVYDDSPAFKVDGHGMVWPAIPLDPACVVEAVQQRIVDVVASAPGGVLDRASLLAACRALGISITSANWYLTYAECLERPARGLFAVRGRTSRPGARAGPRTRARPGRAHGITAEGHPWIAAEVRVETLASGVVYVPAALRPALSARTFTVPCTGAGLAMGMDHSGNSWGWRRPLTDLDAQPGSVIRVTFDPGAGTAALEVGGPDLFQPPFSG